MNKRIWLVIGSLIIISAGVALFFPRTGDKEDMTINTLKKFNSMTTYDEVVSVIGRPSAGGEWAVDRGKVQITFSNNRVTRIKYSDESGETVYSYKKLVD